MAIYFGDRRHVGSFSIPLDSGKAKVDCRIFEKWEDIDNSTTARCGEPGVCQVSKVEGISEKVAQTLEGVIESSLGIKGISEIKAQVKEVLGHEVNWNRSVTTTKTFNFKAPKCGRYTLTIYQLVREYELTYSRRIWRLIGQGPWDKKWVRTFPEDTNKHDGLPDVEEFDETCNCRDAKPTSYDGRLCFDFGNLSFRVPYRLTPGGFDVQILEKVISFTFTDYSAGARGLDQGLNISLPTEVIPEPLRFLSDLSGEHVEARAFRYSEPESGSNFLLEGIPIEVTQLHNILVLPG